MMHLRQIALVGFCEILASAVTQASDATDYKTKYASPTTHGSEAGNNFQQQYANQYASGYEKYMSSGDQGKGGNIPSFASQYVGNNAGLFESYMNEPGSKKQAKADPAPEGGYQQYMKNYAGDYQKYMNNQGGQGGQQSQGGDYQKYLKLYSGDYQKYMKQGGQGGQQSQGGDYQKYMKQYGGDYQKYMKQGSQGGNQSQGGDYQKYMNQYAGDYQKYMNQGGQGGQQSQGGDYQKYLNLYAGDYQKYMKQGSDNTTELAADYKIQYASKWIPSNKNMTQDEAIHQYAAGYVPKVKNASDSKDWSKAYMDKYAGGYGHFMDNSPTTLIAAPREARASHNLTQLRAWRSGQLNQIDSYVPASYQSYAKKSVEQAFDSNEERINGNQTADSAESPSAAATELLATPVLNSKAATVKVPAHKTAREKPATLALAEQPSIKVPFRALHVEVPAGKTADKEPATETLTEHLPSTVSFAALASFIALGVRVAFFGSRRRQPEPDTADGYLHLNGEP